MRGGGQDRAQGAAESGFGSDAARRGRCAAAVTGRGGTVEPAAPERDRRLRSAAPDTTGARPLTAGCLFSGMGGFASGLAAAGFDVRWANDDDPYACATFRHRFPDVALFDKDVRDLSVEGDGLAPVDLLAGGFPCQSFSQAGDRRGFDDQRGRLFFEIVRLIGELAAAGWRPPLVVLENVPFLLCGAAGEWFVTIRRALRNAGYWFRAESCWTVNVKDETDIPQDRERLFLVAASSDAFPYNPFSPPPPPPKNS